MRGLTELVATIKARATGRERVVIAIAGAPGAGKSTLAEALVAALGPEAACLPMDGFHKDNAELDRLGLRARKGAPETFDAEGFVALIRAAKQKKPLSYPLFDRAKDCTVPDAAELGAHIRYVLVEGNYLLLKTPPWNALADLFDLTIGLEVSFDALKARLVQRWRDHGLSEQEAEARACGNDLSNARYVLENAFLPEIVLRNEG